MAQEERKRGSFRDWLSPYVHLSNNWISLTGVVLVTTSVILWLFMLPSTLRGGSENPYLNILSVMVLPATFFAGLLLIPVGQYLRMRREQKQGRLERPVAVLDFRNPDLKRLVVFLLATTVVNLIIGSQLTYRAVHHMESVAFCGTTCHTVMKPEYTAYQNSPHSRVECVKCHIGPGASWAVRSKIDGIRQVFAVALDNYARPIPVPVHSLRPARETCETCHWPQKFGADRLRVVDKFADDETNSRTRTVLLMKLGGGLAGEAARRGIHGAHLAPGITIRYAHSDEARQDIPWFEYSNAATGRKVAYSTGADVSKMQVRTMDCMDCHNRPSHSFDLPERALDRALDAGEIDATLPFAKKQGLEILKADYGTERDAAQRIPAAFEKFYQSSHPDVYAAKRESVRRSGQGLLTLYNRNVFPEMRIKWGTYPNNIGHTDFPGCFRCHDDGHKSVQDNTAAMSQDCNLCHALLAMDEPQPKILSDLGLTEAAGTPAPSAQ